MRLFCKHLLRSLCRSPMQSLLIVLTVALSMAMAVTAVGVCDLVTAYSRSNAEREREIGDVVITTRGNGETRLLFAENARAVVGENASVIGEFSMVGFAALGEAGAEEAVSVSAVDFEATDAFYRFRYLAYGGFDTENVGHRAIISHSFAERAGLGLGDALSLRLMSEEVVYTVGAIAEDSGLLCEREVLVSYSGVIGLLTRKIPAVASLGDSFAPCSRLLVSASDGVSEKSVYETLLSSEELSDKSVTLTENRERTEFWTLFRLVSIYLFLFLLLLLAAFLIGTSLTLLQKRRSGEYAVFSLAGASKQQIGLWSWIESGLYAFCGIAAGTALAVPMTRMAGGLYEWNREPLRIDALSFGVGACMTLVLMGACTLWYCRLGQNPALGKIARKKTLLRRLCPPLLLLAIGSLACACVGIEGRYIPCAAVILSLIWLAFVTASTALKGLAAAWERREEARPAPHACRLLAAKALQRHFALGFACRLLSVTLALLTVLTVCGNILSKQTDALLDGSRADLIAYGLDERSETSLYENSLIRSSLRMYYSADATLKEDIGAVAISLKGDAALFLSDEITPSAIPSGDQLVLSAGLAARAQAAVGDRIRLTVDGLESEFTVSEIVAVHANFLLFDADALGLRRDLCLLEWENDDALAEVSAEIQSDGAYIMESDSLFASLNQSLRGHIALLRYAVLLALFLGLVGGANLLVRLYRDRQEERLRLLECGMERSAVRRSYAWEVLAVLLTAVLVSVLLSALICLMLDVALRSFGMLLFV